jgi:hypothetical protein
LFEIVPLLPLISRVKVDQKEAMARLLLAVFFVPKSSSSKRPWEIPVHFCLKGKSSAPLLATSVVAIVISAGEIWSCG